MDTRSRSCNPLKGLKIKAMLVSGDTDVRVRIMV